jgi:hypothetical protein
MPLKDIVAYLGEKRATGTLSMEHSVHRKQVVLRDGMVVNASSNEPREYLGQFLINLGHITEEQFNKAYQTQKETKIFLGKILVMIGAVTEATVQNALNLKIRETLLHAFHWEEGTFSFDPDAQGALGDGLDLRVDLLDIHREGEFRETAWAAIRNAFPSGQVRLRLHEARLTEPPRPGSLDERLFRLIGQGHTIDELILALHATDFFLYQRLYALYRLEAVSVAEPSDEVEVELTFDPPPQETVGQEASQAEILAAAEACLDQQSFAAAEPLARRAHELGPTPQTAALLQRAEEGLLGQLRGQLLEGKPVASLKVHPSQLKALQLSAPERYLLSRIDGARDVPSIIHVSPLKEAQALRLFQRFIEAGLVSVERR